MCLRVHLIRPIYVGMLKFSEKIESKIADPRSSLTEVTNLFGSSDEPTVCFPCDADAKPSDKPEKQCYKLGR